MRSLVVSDLHSNFAALRAVLTRIRRKRIDQVICLGDFVGYGAQPNQVLDVMRSFPARKFYVRGNHDRVAASLEDGSEFNPAARSAALWTRQRLSGPNRHFLELLPRGPVRRSGITICHGSPADEDEYVFTPDQARISLQSCQSDERILFHGHTHLPRVFSLHPNGEVESLRPFDGQVRKLRDGMQHLINPGSVGQPRDRNPDASFIIFDSERNTVQFFRASYDVEAAQMSILKAGLPTVLADRLSFGA